MRTRKTIAAFALTASMVLAVPVNAAAAVTKPDSMDDQTWARLQDNTLEYDEIADLVEYYNPTYQQVVQTININIDPFSEAEQNLHVAAQESNLDARTAKDDGDVLNYTVYTMTAKAQSQVADAYGKVAKSIRSSTRSTLNSTRKQLINGVQQLMNGYCQAYASKELVDTAVELASAAYDSTVTQRSIGMATDLDVQNSEKSLLSARKQQKSLDDTLTNLKQQLCIMTGWAYDASPEIVPIPAPDLSKIDSMNPENDLETAIGNNYTIIAQRKVSGKGTANHDAKFRTLDESEMKVKIQLQSLYQTVLDSRTAYEAANTAYEAARITMDGNELKYQMGMLGRLQYLQLKVVYLQAKMTAENAALTLTQAMENYNWAVEGLADIS